MRARILLIAAVVVALTQTAGGRNLLENASFEEYDGEQFPGWSWSAGKAQATAEQLQTGGHSGEAFLRLVNPSPKAPHVYGSLWQTVRVRPNTQYTLSCYVRGTDSGQAWIGGAPKWTHRFPFPKHADDWTRVTGTFRTGAEKKSFTVRILTEAPTQDLCIDDVQLERGPAATSFEYIEPLAPGEMTVVSTPFTPTENLVPNPSFETVDGIRPKHWMFDVRNTDAELEVDTSEPHGGHACVKITNGTTFGPHVYAWFGVTGGIAVKPDTDYTVSAYVRSEAPGQSWFGGGQGWRVRVPVPRTHGRWQRVHRTFRTFPDETNLPFMVISESPTDGFWIDDIRLIEGDILLPATETAGDSTHVSLFGPPAEPVFHKGNRVETRWASSLYPSDRWLFCGRELDIRGLVSLPEPPDGPIELRIALLDRDGEEQGSVTQQIQAVPMQRLRLRLAPDGNLANPVVTASVSANGAELARCRTPFRIVTAGDVGTVLTQANEHLDALRRTAESTARGAADPYLRAAITVLEEFIPWTETDAAIAPDRAWHNATVMRDLAARRREEAARDAAAHDGGSAVPRYVTSDLTIDGPSFIGDRRLPDGTSTRGPVFFQGYGHFGQVRKDIERFPDYGLNFCQIEFGPRGVLTAEGTVSDRAIDDFLAVCDRAAKANVAVNLLISPHYFPQWALDKWPDLKECHGGFFKYCVHDPRARAVLETSMRHVIPRIKDHPALHSLCLSNEPICVDLTGCRAAAVEWPRWLKRRHGTIDRLNTRWGTDYAGFDEIRVPPPEIPGNGRSYDFVCFNQEQFAEFHRWMADIIHEMAPEIPVHAKIMMSAHFNRGLHGMWSVSPQLFGELSQIHGNDCCTWYRRSGEWNNSWLRHQMAYDFQRSMGDKPVFNSENHVIIDRDHDVIPPEHIYSALWQGALHGECASTMWVWERTNDHESSITGSIFHRPACAEVVGRACLDLNSLAGEMTALQKLPPKVVFLWSLATVVHTGPTHPYLLNTVYEAFNFVGVPLGFTTERHLAAYARGEDIPSLPPGAVLVLPGTTHLPDEAVAGIAKLLRDGRAVSAVGQPGLRDAYGIERTPPRRPTGANLNTDDRDELFAWAHRLVEGTAALPDLLLLGDDGRIPYGVEIRSARHNGTRIAAVCNHLREPRTVRLVTQRGAPVAAVDLISRRHIDGPFTAQPMQPLLLREE